MNSYLIIWRLFGLEWIFSFLSLNLGSKTQSNLDSFFSSAAHRNYKRSLHQQYRTLNFVVMRHQRRISFLLSSPKKSSPSSAELSTSVTRCVSTMFSVCSSKNVFCFAPSSPWWFNNMLSTSRTFGWRGAVCLPNSYNWWLPVRPRLCQTPTLLPLNPSTHFILCLIMSPSVDP